MPRPPHLATAEAVLRTTDFVIRGVDKSLLGCGNTISLGIIEFYPEVSDDIRSVNKREEKKGSLEN